MTILASDMSQIRDKERRVQGVSWLILSTTTLHPCYNIFQSAAGQNLLGI